jgi:hypothetical protein
MNLPQMFLKFCKEGITLEIYEYFRRCTANQPEQWCSIISASKELSDNDIVLLADKRHLRGACPSMTSRLRLYTAISIRRDAQIINSSHKMMINLENSSSHKAKIMWEKRRFRK